MSCGGREITGGGVLWGSAPTGAQETDEMLPQTGEQTPAARIDGLVVKCATGRIFTKHHHK